MKISMIAAVGSDLGIGKDGKLLFHIREDMLRFKTLTMGHSIIMGRKTYESLPHKLPGRRNIVISRTMEGDDVYKSLEEALKSCESEDEVFIIGGQSIYKQALPLADTLYLTEVHASPDSDTKFPEFYADFELTEREYHYDNNLAYEFCIYQRA